MDVSGLLMGVEAGDSCPTCFGVRRHGVELDGASRIRCALKRPPSACQAKELSMPVPEACVSIFVAVWHSCTCLLPVACSLKARKRVGEQRCEGKGRNPLLSEELHGQSWTQGQGPLMGQPSPAAQLAPTQWDLKKES